MSEYSDQLKNRVWSYSSVHQYDDCPYGFYLQRIQKVPQKNNAFALYGSFMHEILEKYFKGLITIPEMRELYETDYANRVNIKFPPNKWVDLAQSYYDDGLQFLDSFTGLNEKYKVLGVELEVKLPIEGYKTIGYIDLLLENTETDELTVVDHKSKKRFSSKKEELDYRRQLLFYGIYVKHLFGKYPSFVDFDLFRSHQHVIAPFSESECDEVKNWFVQTIDAACHDEIFEDKIKHHCRETFEDVDTVGKNDFFCSHICSVRESCPRSSAYKKRSRRKKKGDSSR